MLTKNVRIWLERVRSGQYSYETAMSEFANFSSYLTHDEINIIKRKLNETHNLDKLRV